MRIGESQSWGLWSHAKDSNPWILQIPVRAQHGTGGPQSHADFAKREQEFGESQAGDWILGMGSQAKIPDLGFETRMYSLLSLVCVDDVIGVPAASCVAA